MLRQLGLDEATANELIASQQENTMPQHDTRRIRARDNDDPLDVQSILEFVEQAAEGLAPEEAEQLADELETRLLTDDPIGADRRGQRRAADARSGRRSRRRLGRDEPPEFPGRPTPGGWQDPPNARAEDRHVSRRALHGMDSTPVKSFEELFPAAKNIAVGFTTGRGSVML
jgi:hypothetical protein